MGVFSWFRRREAVLRASGDQGGGAVAVLDPVVATDQERDGHAEQEVLPGVPAARTAPDAVAEAGAEAVAEEAQAAAQVAVPADDSQQGSRPERPDTGDEAMGVMDNLKGMAEELKEKASHLAGQHVEKIDEVVDKTGEAIDKVTKGKYTDKIATGTEKAKGAVEGFAEKPHDAPEPSEPSEPSAAASGETAAPPAASEPGEGDTRES